MSAVIQHRPRAAILDVHHAVVRSALTTPA
ncbi:hypothetical protein JO379_000776 [Streptomyces syringium]|uniref:Uncharacterized protein n=1 Tax=Streptomyces syringium TaxID=76729 RepID=A0ABS4XYJ7_9ACTN|nr:hypothetical protein [Streptomyces syringium]